MYFTIVSPFIIFACSIALSPILFALWAIYSVLFKPSTKKEVTPHKEVSKEEKYRNAIHEYGHRLLQLERDYRGINNFSYDFEKYFHPIIEKFLEEIKLYVVYRNNLNRREWWLSLDGYQFEDEVASWYRRKGYYATVTPKSGDGGVDIIVRSSARKKYYVQCKHFTNKKVDAPTVQQLYGACAADGALPVIACLLGLTPNAEKFARKVGVKVITLEDFLVEDNPPSKEGEYILFDQDGNPVPQIPLQMSPKIIKRNETSIQIGDIIISTNIAATEQELMKHNNGYKDYICYKKVYVSICADSDRISDLKYFCFLQGGY